MGAESEKKKSGCCSGGCLGLLFWVALFFSAGWYTCNLEHNGWDISRTNEDSLARAGAHYNRIKDWIADSLGGLFGGKGGKKAVSEIPGMEDWAGRGDEAMSKARALLQQASQASGEERGRLLRVAKRELQIALENYTKAEQVNTGSQELLQKIAQVSKLLEQLQRY